MKIGELKGRDFLKLLDFTNEEVQGLVDLAAELKAQKKAGIPHEVCKGKHVALIFEKTSTRTRCSFEVAAADLGMHSTYLDPTGSQARRRASLTRPGCCPAFMTALSTGATASSSWRSWRSTPLSPCGTA